MPTIQASVFGVSTASSWRRSSSGHVAVVLGALVIPLGLVALATSVERAGWLLALFGDSWKEVKPHRGRPVEQQLWLPENVRSTR